MEVTVIGKLTGAQANAKTQQSAAASTDFSSVLGQVLSADNEDSTPRKAQKNGGNQNTRKDVQDTNREPDRKADVKDDTAPQKEDTSPAADAQALAGAEQSAAQAAAQSTVQNTQTVIPAQTATAQTAPAAVQLPAEAVTEPVPVLTAETLTANIKTELQKTADTFQTTLAAQADAASQQVQTPAEQQTASTPQTVQTDAQTVPVQAAAAEPTAKTDQTTEVQTPAAESKPAEQPAAETVQQPAAPSQKQSADAQTQTDSGGTAQAETAAEVKPAETKKTDTRAAAQFSTTVTAQTAPQQTQDTTEMQAAVNRALDQFDQDFQGFSADTKNLQISLHPKELGTVSISLAAGSSGVTAKIQTSSAEAASLLSAQVQRMIESMEAKGVRVQNVEVVLTQTPQQNTGNADSGASQQYQSQNTRLYASGGVSTVEKGSALNDYERMTQSYSASPEDGQRVEYRV